MPRLTGSQKWERQLVVEQYVRTCRWYWNGAYSKRLHVRQALRFLRAEMAAGATADQAIRMLEDMAWQLEEAYETRPGPTALGLNPSQG